MDQKNGNGNGNGGGNGRSCRLFGKEAVTYPVSFDLKAIIDAGFSESSSKTRMEGIMDGLGVRFTNWRIKKSSAGRYNSYTILVDIESREMLNKLYEELKTVPGLKFAL
jgi:putative lipoic acid-binding regulatory protein